MICNGAVIAEYDRDYRHNSTHYRLEHYIGLIEKRPRSVYNAAPIKATVPKKFYQFMMKLYSHKEIVKALRVYLNTGNELLKYLSHADYMILCMPVLPVIQSAILRQRHL